jgi:hypothetical protein
MKVTLNNPSIKNYGCKNKNGNSEEKFFKIIEEIHSSNSEFNISSKSKGKTEYILEGGVIKVYVSDGKNPPKCIKSIPAKCASKELLAKVKCQTIADALYLKDLMESNDNPDKKVSEDVSNNKDNLMDNYDSIPYLRSRYICNEEHSTSE